MIRKVFFRRILKILAFFIGGLVLLSITLSLLLLIPSVQTFVANKATQILSEKTGIAIQVGELHIDFPKTIRLNGLFVADTKKDTLVYCDELDINASLLQLLKKTVNISDFKIKGLTGKAYRNQNDSLFNFSPVISAFSGNSGDKKKSEDPSDWQLSFDDIELENIRLNFSDFKDSTFYDLDLGRLLISANQTDLTNLKFDLEEIEVSNTKITMALLGDASEKLEKKETSPIPIELSLNKLSASNLLYQLNIGNEKLALRAAVKEAEIKPELLDLTNSHIVLEEISVNGISTSLGMTSSDTTELVKSKNNSPVTDYTFGNFDWNFLVRHAEIRNTDYKMDLNKNPRLVSGMDYMHMDFSNFNVIADSIFFNKDETGVRVNELIVKEVSGPEVKQLSGTFYMNNQKILAENVRFKTANSNIAGNIKLSYPSMRTMGSNLSRLGIESSLQGAVNPKDAMPFTSVLSDYPFLQQIGIVNVQYFESEGTLGNLALKKIETSFANDTKLALQANVQGLPGTNLIIDYNLDTLITSKNDLITFLTDTLLPQNLNLPETYHLKSKGSSNLKDGNIEAQLATDLGKSDLVFALKNNEFTGSIDLKNLELGSILTDTTLGNITLKGAISGTMKDYMPEQFTSNVEVSSFEWNNNKFEQTELQVSLNDNVYGFQVNLEDSSIVTSMEGKYYRKDSVVHFATTIDIKKIELQGLNLMEEYFKCSGVFAIESEIHPDEEIYGNINCKDLRLDKTDKSYFIKTVNFKSHATDEIGDFYLTSDILDATLTGNTRLNELDSAIMDHIDLYLTLPDSIISSKDFTFDFDLTLKRPDFFTDFFIEDLDEFELENCSLHYNDRDDILTADISIPALTYQDIHFKDLSLVFDTQSDSALATLQLSETLINDISIPKIALETVFRKNEVDFGIHSWDLRDSLKYELKYLINYADSIYDISIDPKQLVIKYDHWNIPEDNLLRIDNGQISTRSSTISKGDQKVSLNAKNKNLSLDFFNFDLANITEVLVQDSLTDKVNGSLNGSVLIDSVFQKSKITADLKTNNLVYGGSALGDLTANINYMQGNPFKFDVELINEENSIHASGITEPTSEYLKLNTVLELNVTNAQVFEPVLSDYLSDLDGQITGRIALSGNSQNPELNGSLGFNAFKILLLPTYTALNLDGRIVAENNEINFNNFSIRDNQQNPMAIQGLIDLRNYYNPLFDLKVSAPKYQIVHAPITGKNIIEGDLNMGIDLNIKGRKSKLKVENNLSIIEGTNIYYLMPGNELELITDEGIVEYVDFDDLTTDTVFTKKTTFIGDSIVSLIKGIDFTTSLSVSPAATFTVIVDPNSGDFTEFNLNGQLRYIFNDAQRGKLSGLLEFQKGFYELSFYGLVKKRFQYEPGSTVNWSGDVMDGALNFTARHTVRTNSIGLVSNEISSSERQLYNQRLPYDVILKIENKISSPIITFGLDLPERYRSTYPTLDSKLNFLNQPNMESERNKQVFALLVGGTFIPEDPSITEGSGGSNFATTAARNSVNAIMTQQLNKFTGQFIEGLDVDMGVNTFDDYGTGRAQSRTQLDVKVSKNLFNDRVTAEMESHINLDGSVKEVGSQNTAGMTEFAISYKLTETGNYRIKAFRENAYDIFDGEIQNSGIAFILIKEFDTFRKKQEKELQKNPEQQETDTKEENE